MPTELLDLPNDVLRDLMVDVLSRGEPFHLNGGGWSMSPLIKPGDSLVVLPISRSPRVGQVVAFIQPGSRLLLIHRVLRKEGDAYWIQGDNMAGKNDGWISRSCIIGVVDQVTRGGENVRFGKGAAGYAIAVLSQLGLLSPIVKFLHFVFGSKRK